MDKQDQLAEIEDSFDIPRDSLLIFDDVVLLKIMEHLAIVDLTNLIETCKRMESLVSEYLRRNRTSVHWMDHRRSGVSTIKPSETERVFKHIGKHLKIIKLSMWEDFGFYQILVVLARECPQMDTLVLDSIRLNRPLTLCDPLIKIVFSRLKRFVLNACYWRGWCPLEIFFGDNRTLDDLAVINCCAYNGNSYRLQMAGFHSLTKLRLIRCRNVVTEDELQVCFANNNIECLVLNDIGNVSVFPEKLIAQLEATIDDLTIDFFNAVDAHQLVRLKKLHTLRLRCNVYTDLDNLLVQLGADDSKLEELVVLRICVSSATMEALKQFKRLKRLRLDQCVNTVPRQFFRTVPKILPLLQHFIYTNSSIRDEDVLFLYRSLPQLSLMNLYGCNSLATKTYLEIINILENDWHRPRLQLVPPKWETMRSFLTIKNAKKRIWLRTDTGVVNLIM